MSQSQVPAVPEPPQLNSVATWTSILAVLAPIAVAVGVLVGHPLNSDIVAAVVPSIAVAIASVCALLMHKNVVAVQTLHYQAKLDQHRAVVHAHLNPPLSPTQLPEALPVRGNSPNDPMYVEVIAPPPSTPPDVITYVPGLAGPAETAARTKSPVAARRNPRRNP